MKKLVKFFKNASTFVKEAISLIGIIIFVLIMFTFGSIVYRLRANLKFRRKCRKIWRAMQKVWQTIQKVCTSIIHKQQGNAVNAKLWRKCQEIAKTVPKMWETVTKWFKQLTLEKGVEKPEKHEKAKRLKKEQKPNNPNKQDGQCEIFSGQARVIKRVYKPSYTKVNFFTGRETYHEEEHITYIEYEGKKYKLMGKKQFMKFAEADVIQIKGEKTFSKKGLRKHVQIQQVELMAA